MWNRENSTKNRRYRQGSHIRLACPGRTSITVPDHKLVGHGLLRRILRNAELSVEEFMKLARR
jgi:hypothetical protein